MQSSTNRIRPLLDGTRRAAGRSARVALALPLLGALLACGQGSRDEAEPLEPDPETLRTVAQGEIGGFTGRYGSHVWLGVPYAAPPEGDLRWRAPRPATAWSGIRPALSPGAICPQRPSRLGGVSGDADEVVGEEDCLTLAIYAPRRSPSGLPAEGERWPVMVWIHGGGNVAGYTGFYDGGRLAQEHQVVVVMPQYRLGPLGWFRHASLRTQDSSPEDASGNFGTLDLIQALEWVQQNVAAFGGDPTNVTIFGESAGGRNVMSLVLAERASGLFHRAISQSGQARLLDPAQVENPVDAATPGMPGSSGEVLLRLLQNSTPASTRDAAVQRAKTLTPEETADFLRSVDPETLLAAYDGVSVPNVFGEGTVLPEGDPIDRLRESDGHNDVPVLLGTNRDEHKVMLLDDPEYVRNWFSLYIRVRDPERFEATSAAYSRMWKAQGADELARALAESGSAAWVYRFDWDEQPSLLGTDLSQILGAAHGMEIPFVFDHFELGPFSSFMYDDENAPGRQTLTSAMQSYWVQFARTGDPGTGIRGDLPRWTPWSSSAGAPKMMILDTPADGGVRMSPESLTAEAVVAEISADPRFPSPRERCTLLADLADRYPHAPTLLARAATCPIPDVASD